MAIKIYQTQIRPTTEVKERASTPGMKISLDTAAAPGRAFGNMMAAGEKLYVKLEERKSRNSALEAKDKAINGIKDENGNVIVEGLGMAKEKAGNMTNIDEAQKYYDNEFSKVKSLLEPDLKVIFAKKLFNNEMTRLGISDKNSVKINSYRAFLNESKVIELKSMEPDKYTAATAIKGSPQHTIALENLKNKFASKEFKDLFGDKAKLIEFQTYEDIDVLEFSADLEKDAIDTYDKIKSKGKDGFSHYKNLSSEKRLQLENRAKNAAMAKAGTYIVEDYENAKKGEPAKYTKEKLLSAFIGTDKYDLVNEQLSINEIVRENSQLITNSNYGEEDNIINNIEVKGEAIKYKEKAVKVLENLKSEKRNEIQKDAAGYYIKYDEDLQIIDKEIKTALASDNTDRVVELTTERSALLDEIYEEKGVPPALRKYITDVEANNIVNTFKALKDPNEQINYLESLKGLYGNKMQDVFNHLVDKKMPPGSMIMMVTNSEDLKKSISLSTDVKSLETNIMQKTDLKKADLNTIKFEIRQELESTYSEVVNAQPIGSVSQASHINSITDGLYGAVLYKMFDENKDKETAAQEVVEQFESDYQFEDTYWIPKDVNGTPVNQQDIKAKVDFINDSIQTTDYLNKIDFTHYGELVEDMSPEDTQKTMVNDIKDNGVWYLNPKGDGLLLYVTRNGGEPIPVMDKDGNKLELLFLNNETLLPITGDKYEYSNLDFTDDRLKGYPVNYPGSEKFNN